MRVLAAAGVMLALGLALAAPRFAGAQAPPVTPASPAAPAPASLYQRLGGYDSLAVITDDFVGRLARDPALARFFARVGAEARGRIRQLLLDQLCAASGGPCIYPGRDMKTAHQGLGIGEREWAVTIGHLIASLDRYKVGPKEKDEVLQWVARLKRDIVEKP
jgi:hemoglobin